MRKVKKEVKKKEIPKVEAPKAEKVDATNLKTKHSELIKYLQGKLLTNEQLKRGGPGVRVKHELEKGYIAVIDEINEIGKELGLPKVSIGSLRK